ncbi:hypothetical protein AEST_22280 [Alishewanella aestuarii B11]|uniref:Uncharacterized protein n=1 Tax=Alishewanella aestuarii B11 TaxID=1197174 RepID=J1QHX3_9ALTE|nr:hypothetical protein AEST_22280 [Alishewanella aestuarii B11]
MLKRQPKEQVLLIKTAPFALYNCGSLSLFPTAKDSNQQYGEWL